MSGLDLRGAALACPSCGHPFTGKWVGAKTGPQDCPSCGHRFDATWPGFRFEPETVIVRGGDDDAA